MSARGNPSASTKGARISVIPFDCNIESFASISASIFSFLAMSVRTRSAGLVGDGRVYPIVAAKRAG